MVARSCISMFCDCLVTLQVGQGHLCLWCNERGKRFETREDVQRHMVSKGHCKLLHDGETLIEYDQW